MYHSYSLEHYDEYRYEKVHPTRRFSDLKTRLGPGRRCFAFVRHARSFDPHSNINTRRTQVHPTLPEEPLVFVHVALVRTFKTMTHFSNPLEQLHFKHVTGTRNRKLLEVH